MSDFLSSRTADAKLRAAGFYLRVKNIFQFNKRNKVIKKNCSCSSEKEMSNRSKGLSHAWYNRIIGRQGKGAWIVSKLDRNSTWKTSWKHKNPTCLVSSTSIWLSVYNMPYRIGELLISSSWYFLSESLRITCMPPVVYLEKLAQFVLIFCTRSPIYH